MKLKLQCPFCKISKNSIKPKGPLPLGTSYNIIANSESNISTIECGGMHVSVVCFTNQKFDLLFESGLNAINDIYFREAIASIATSLERFYEFSIKILTHEIETKTVNASWKKIANSSERQLGAFIFLYVKEFNKSPKFLSDKMIEFRNKVIHKGYFPDYEETIKFTEEVKDIITENFNELKKSKTKEIEEYEKEYILELKNSAITHIASLGKKMGENNPWKIVPRPFMRDIPTFLSQYGKIKISRKSDLENYLFELPDKSVD